jgi:ribosomal protein S18 acetylase RimI-like enzyme
VRPSRSKYLTRKVASYVSARLATPLEDAVLLVALPHPADSDDDATAAAATSAAADGGDLPPVCVLGVCELSLAPRTRSFEDPALAAPPHGRYVKNMSVSPGSRRRGVGAALLAAAEAYALAADDAAPRVLPPGRQYAPPLEVYLHVAVADDGARLLYERAGYVRVAEQSALAAALRRSGPRVALMRKRLRD